MPDKTELKPVAYFSATKEGKIIWSEDCCCEDPIYPRHDDDDSISLAVYSESSKQSLQQEIEQLRNEVETLKKEAVQRVVTQLSTVFVKEGSYSNCEYIHYAALCNDGTMWFKEHDSHTWQEIQNVPQPAPEGDKP